MKSLLKGYKLDKMKMKRMLLAFILGMFLISLANAQVIVNNPANGSTTIFSNTLFNLTTNYSDGFKNISLITNISGSWAVNNSYNQTSLPNGSSTYNDVNEYTTSHTYNVPDGYINYVALDTRATAGGESGYVTFTYENGSTYVTSGQVVNYLSWSNDVFINNNMTNKVTSVKYTGASHISFKNFYAYGSYFISFNEIIPVGTTIWDVRTCLMNDSCEYLGNYTIDRSLLMLNLTFDGLTNASITWLGGGLTYENTNNITIPIDDINATGEVQVSFNDDTQLYSFYNTGTESVNASLHLETIDFDQPVKVMHSSNELQGALITFYKDNKVTYSAFTDINGIAHILVNDGTTYEVHVEKDGYWEYAELTYIPTSNTDTIIINMLSQAETTGNYFFSSTCTSVVGEERNCSYFVKSFTEKNITFNYTWWGLNYTITHEGSEANLTLVANSSTLPIYVTISVNPTRTFATTWDGLVNRSIQLSFDATEIKDESKGVLVLFYAIIFILGIMIMIVTNRIPKMGGKGYIAMEVWFGIMAVKFPLLWFIVVPIAIYVIFDVFWGEED